MDVRDRAAGTFVGRQSELVLLRAHLAAVREGEPRVILIEGPAGIGKTALCERFLVEACDLRILRATGDQEEHLLSYGVVEQLVRSARTTLKAPLDELRATSDRIPETMTVGAALIDLLSGLQECGPVAVVIDDAQWADRLSLLALLFALRRLQADRVLGLIAARDDGVNRLPEGLLKVCAGRLGDTLRLGGLDTRELQELAASINVSRLPSELATKLCEHTGGSPLHLRALLEELPAERLRSPADAPLPSPRPYSMQVLARLAGCAHDAQRLVVAASILGPQCRLLVAGELAGIDQPLVALEQAMSAGLLDARDVDGEPCIAFPHALIRAAVYHDIGPARRADLHLRAATLVQERVASLRHRSAAALGEDDVLASELADYAHEEAARGTWSASAAALLRSSQLSSVRGSREQRLLESVDCLLVAGELARAEALTEQVRACTDGPYRDYILGRLAYHAGRLADGRDLLLSAWHRCVPADDPHLASRIAAENAIVLVRRARGPELVAWAERASGAEGFTLAHSALAYGWAYAGRATEGLAELSHLPDCSPEELTAEQMDLFLARGMLRMFTDDLPGARADMSPIVPAAARWGPYLARFAALSLLSCVEYRLGEWDDAITHGEAAVSLAESADQAWLLSWMHSAATAPLAGRGQWDVAVAHVAAAVEYARGVSDENSVADVAMARGLLAAARADHEEVVSAFMPLVALPQREGIDEPGTRWPWQELYADALVSLDRLKEARAVLVPFEERAAARGRRSAMASAARVRGNLEAAARRFDEAEHAFRTGIAHLEGVCFPFDRARLEVAYGRLLRRLGRRASAVTHLKIANALFAQLGARPYAESCEQVLRLCGVVADSRERHRANLTPPEVAVARLVSKGLSNREVAAQLVVSVNTVEYHLKNIYAKLGIFSRRQLMVERADPELGVAETPAETGPVTGTS